MPGGKGVLEASEFHITHPVCGREGEMGGRDMATLASLHGATRGGLREGASGSRERERRWHLGLLFFLRQVRLVPHRQEWLRVQKGARGHRRGSNWARVGRQGQELSRGPASHLHTNHSIPASRRS